MASRGVTNPSQGIYAEITPVEAAQIAGGLHVACPATVFATAGANQVLFGPYTLNHIGFRQLYAFLNVSAAAAAAGDTLDVLIDVSPDDGSTWDNVIHFTQVLGNGGAKKFLAVTPGPSAAVASADVSADLAAAATPRNFFGQTFRVRGTVVDGGAHGQSFTVGLELFLLS